MYDGQSYSLSNTMASIRRRLGFELLKATLIDVQGHKHS